MKHALRAVASTFTDRATFVPFVLLSAGWLLPSTFPAYAHLAYPLLLPAYLVSMVTYDGLIGLEQVVYTAQNAAGGEWAYAWDAGLIVTFYLFSVVATLFGPPLKRRFSPGADDDKEQAIQPTIRYTVAAGLLLVGLLLVAQGVVSQPMMTSVSCTDSSSASQDGSGTTATATPECTRTTEPATGAQLYVVGLGAAVGLVGAGVVAVDRRLASGA